MSATVVVRISCDARGCQAFRETRQVAATAATERLRAIDAGWSSLEGDDHCPEHASKRVRPGSRSRHGR